MNEVYKVIGDVEELKYFYDNIVAKPLDGESIMICHSARAKKLTEEERKGSGISRAEMFHTEISKKRVGKEYDWTDFLSLVSKLEVNKNAYLTETKKYFPDKALVTYIYMNPCDEAACAQDTFNRINTINAELINASIKGSIEGVKNSVWKLSTISKHIKSCHAQNPSRRVWIDFDIDCSDLDEDGINLIKEVVIKMFGEDNSFLIRTSGGVHCLVKKEALKFNPNNFIENIKIVLIGYDVSEIIKNDNCMIPLPGSYQYGNIVKVIRW